MNYERGYQKIHIYLVLISIVVNLHIELEISDSFSSERVSNNFPSLYIC